MAKQREVRVVKTVVEDHGIIVTLSDGVVAHISFLDMPNESQVLLSFSGIDYAQGVRSSQAGSNRTYVYYSPVKER